MIVYSLLRWNSKARELSLDLVAKCFPSYCVGATIRRSQVPTLKDLLHCHIDKFVQQFRHRFVEFDPINFVPAHPKVRQ